MRRWTGCLRGSRRSDALAARHLTDGTLVLYDVSSAAFEGRTCSLGEIGHARDGARGRLQIVYGVLTATEGIPVAVQVFKGSTGDPATLADQVTKLKERFGLSHVALVDRGMLTKARINNDVKPARPDRHGRDHPPGLPRAAADRLPQPLPGAGRARTRAELLDGTEAELEKIAAAASRARRAAARQGQDRPGGRQGSSAKRKAAKHFILDISDDGLAWQRGEQKITGEAALDGIYMIRPPDALPAAGAVESYKAPENVERAFRGLNTDLLIRPIRHRLADRVRAEVLIRMLADYVTWHMQQRLARSCSKTTTPPPPRLPVRARSRPPSVPRPPWPRPPPRPLRRASPCTASPPC